MTPSARVLTAVWRRPNPLFGATYQRIRRVLVRVRRQCVKLCPTPFQRLCSCACVCMYMCMYVRTYVNMHVYVCMYVMCVAQDVYKIK